MIETVICIAMAWGYDCNWTLIYDVPLGELGGLTHYNMKVIYMAEWNPCILAHEINEHAKAENNVIHWGICKPW